MSEDKEQIKPLELELDEVEPEELEKKEPEDICQMDPKENEQIESENNEKMPSEDILDQLPPWPTKIVKIENDKVTFLINAKTGEEFKQWIMDYEEKSFTSYKIRTTFRGKGRYVVFKQLMVCHHNTRHKETYETSTKNIKNTNCPARIFAKIAAIKEKYRGKCIEKKPNPDFPCKIVMTMKHNHDIKSADFLRFRKVSEDVDNKLIALFKKGHSPTSALKMIKLEIVMNNVNHEEMLVDRYYCPDYNHCIYIYNRLMGKSLSKKEFNVEDQQQLLQRLEEFNKTCNEPCMKAYFDADNYVICICTPMMKRVHNHISTASEIVYLDSTDTLDTNGSSVYFLFTDSEFGGLPLGIIVTSSEKSSLLTKGFEFLTEIVGENLFGGAVGGPSIFITDDSITEIAAVQTKWPDSKCFIGTFHILQSFWKWITSLENEILKDDHWNLFLNTKKVVFSETIPDLETNYEALLNISKNYDNYIKHLKNYWDSRKNWALCYRSNCIVRDNHLINYSEATLLILKENIFQRAKNLNVIQLIDFLIFKVSNYYEKHLLEAVNNQMKKLIFSKEPKGRPTDFASQITQISEFNHTYLVPCEKGKDLCYWVDTDALICSCTNGNISKICNHIEWVCRILDFKENDDLLDQESIKEKFYLIAKGTQFSSEMKTPKIDQSFQEIYPQEVHSLSESQTAKVCEDVWFEIIDANSSNSNTIREPPPLAYFANIPVPSTSTKPDTSILSSLNLTPNTKIPINSKTNINSQEEIIAEGKNLIKNITMKLEEFLNANPEEFFPTLKSMNENLFKIKTTSVAVSKNNFSKVLENRRSAEEKKYKRKNSSESTSPRKTKIKNENKSEIINFT